MVGGSGPCHRAGDNGPGIVYASLVDQLVSLRKFADEVHEDVWLGRKTIGSDETGWS